MHDLKNDSRADLYNDEVKYWPWGKALEETADEIACRTPPHGIVHDWMCGTVALLRSVHVLRPDLSLMGMDANLDFVTFAAEHSPDQIRFVHGDALQYSPGQCDLAVSTGSLHHLQEEGRPQVLNKMWNSLVEGGRIIILDEILPPYGSEAEREEAVHLLHKNYEEWIKENSMPPEQAAEIRRLYVCDLHQLHEWKYDLARLEKIMPAEIESKKIIWPSVDDYGDILLVTKPKTRNSVHAVSKASPRLDQNNL